MMVGPVISGPPSSGDIDLGVRAFQQLLEQLAQEKTT